jgi:hypothetical protein
MKGKPKATKSNWYSLAVSLARDGSVNHLQALQAVWFVEKLGVLCLENENPSEPDPVRDQKRAMLRQRLQDEGIRTSSWVVSAKEKPRAGRVHALRVRAGAEKRDLVAKTWNEIGSQLLPDPLKQATAPAAELGAESTQIVASQPTILKGRCLKVLPNPVYLRVRHGAGKRFRQLFLKVWERLPFGISQRISRHWRNCPSGIVALSPVIELRQAWLGMRRNDLARTDQFGHRIYFRSSYVDEMSESAVQTMIASELAHVLFQELLAREYPTINPGRHKIIGDEEGREWGGLLGTQDEVRVTIFDWGFDDEAIIQWRRETGREES